MSNAAFTYTNDDGVEFVWHGGEYIDVGQTATEDCGPRNNLGQYTYDKGDFMAVECINVWNHAKDEPEIERSLEAFQERCDEWYFDNKDYE